MFNKKINVEFHRNTYNGYSSDSSSELNMKQFMSYLDKLRDKYGKIVIERIDLEKETIYLTTADTIKYHQADNKAEEIKELIYEHITKE